MDEQFDVSVVIGTYNRAHLLADAIRCLLAQAAEGVRYELIVVDNNSTDNTREVVQSFVECHIPVSYVREEKQGISYARNAGINKSLAPIIAFTDDDIRATPNWVATIKKQFDARPEIGFIGGRVLPVWDTPAPKWLTSDHWMPLGILDHGNKELLLYESGVIGVIGANLAVRRELFAKVGMFAPEVQLVKGGIGTMEDHEFIGRMWRAGITGLYVPELIVHAPVEPARIQKKYPRRWHKGHGRSHAILREERMERSAWHLFGVPAHLYRQALIDLWGLIKHSLLGREAQAFLCEVQLRFFFAFWLRRVTDQAKAT